MTKALRNEADKITKMLVKKYKPERVILFGSTARNEDTKNSDLDIFIVKKTKKSFFDRLAEIEDIVKTDYPLDVVVMTPSEFDRAVQEKRVFIQQILKYGKTLYDSTYVQ